MMVTVEVRNHECRRSPRFECSRLPDVGIDDEGAIAVAAHHRNDALAGRHDIELAVTIEIDGEGARNRAGDEGRAGRERSVALADVNEGEAVRSPHRHVVGPEVTIEIA